MFELSYILSLLVNISFATPRQDLPGQTQAVDNLPAYQVLLKDFLEILAVHIGIPNRLRIDDDYGSLGAPIQAARRVYPDAPWTRDAQILRTALEVTSQILGAALGATLAAIFSAVGAEKDVSAVIRHGGNCLPG
jgi:hypothetical protein